MRRAVLALLVLLLPAGLARAQPAGTPVRVGLLVGAAAVTVRADGPVEVADLERTVVLGPGAYRVLATGDGLEVAGAGAFSEVVRFRATAPLRVEEKRRAYRGVIEIRRDPQGVTVVNELDLEQYLYGVIKAEVDPQWPPEAVRAQAVAARTLALASLGRYRREGYDVRDTTESQVYGGVYHEDASATAAVDTTRGVIVTYGGRPISAAFHADSGGHTEDSELVWGGVVPYLRGVPDPYASDSPHHEWETRITAVALTDALRRAGIVTDAVRRIEVVRRSPTGRILILRVVGERGAVDLSGTRFRAAVGDAVVRSTLFDVLRQPEDGEAVFHGFGWGHGVGLSQWGARGMALAGKRYDEILRYYYTGAAVTPAP